MKGKNESLQRQTEILHEIIRLNHPLYDVIKAGAKFNLKNYYIGAGCIAQTIWNYQLGNPLLFGISDVDFVYFDEDLSFDAEDKIIHMIKNQLSTCPLSIDVKNQARVHIWYKEHFGYDIVPYSSAEAAVNTWPTTATSVGIRLNDGNLHVYAPYGLNDLFSQIVRPNKTQITEEIYNKKADKWRKTWPSLSIIPW